MPLKPGLSQICAEVHKSMWRGRLDERLPAVSSEVSVVGSRRERRV